MYSLPSSCFEPLVWLSAYIYLHNPGSLVSAVLALLGPSLPSEDLLSSHPLPAR